MGQYRITRNIEASVVDQIVTALGVGGWNDIRVEKAFAKVYNGELPCIAINVIKRIPAIKEIGSKQTLKIFELEFRIFATSDGQRLDLSDFLQETIEQDFDYFSYTITGGVISAKVLNGRIIVRRFLSNKKELINTENLEKEDKFRHIISVEVFVTN